LAGERVSEFLLLVLAWWLMMAGMMLPVTLPWFRTLRRLSGPDGPGPLVGFGLGYFGVWLAFSVGAASLQTGLAANGLFALGATTPAIGGALLLIAGLYQLSPLKTSCLKHCRSPMSFFLARWDDGPVHTLRLGTEHGLFCLGCCWALMLLGFAMGVMNWWWMAVLAGIVALENLSRHGRTVSRVVGLGLVVLAFSAFT
jgi:predicted metal-binding membrane protein